VNQADDDRGVRPTIDEIRTVAQQVAALYWMGGPMGGGIREDPWHAGNAHGFIFAVLDHTDMSSPLKYWQALRDAAMDRPDGLRAFLRLATSSAVNATISWILGEPGPIYPELEPHTMEEVLDLAAGIAYWDFDDTIPPRW
jgi:hypothetical protein